jgi:hypothetical protein
MVDSPIRLRVPLQLPEREPRECHSHSRLLLAVPALVLVLVLGKRLRIPMLLQLVNPGKHNGVALTRILTTRITGAVCIESCLLACALADTFPGCQVIMDSKQLDNRVLGKRKGRPRKLREFFCPRSLHV